MPPVIRPVPYQLPDTTQFGPVRYELPLPGGGTMHVDWHPPGDPRGRLKGELGLGLWADIKDVGGGSGPSPVWIDMQDVGGGRRVPSSVWIDMQHIGGRGRPSTLWADMQHLASGLGRIIEGCAGGDWTQCIGGGQQGSDPCSGAYGRFSPECGGIDIDVGPTGPVRIPQFEPASSPSSGGGGGGGGATTSASAPRLPGGGAASAPSSGALLFLLLALLMVTE